MPKIAGKTIPEWIQLNPLIEKIISTEEVFWQNPHYNDFEKAIKNIQLTEEDVKDAESRLHRFAPYIKKVFPETEATQGIIESPLHLIPKMKRSLEDISKQTITGKLFLKCDSHLPISGSIKARGGIYEVLKHAEDLAIANNLLKIDEDYAILTNPEFKEFFSNYSIIVGSTGNLGLSIGIISVKIGFNVTVHMSSDAKAWKKKMLIEKGVKVVEHDSDYSAAVAEGRKQADENPNFYFIDDENSTTLFLGYAVAAYRLRMQLEELQIQIDDEHPLFVYLPCGVGGGPGGIAFGLKLVFKNNVHCFFAEPTHSPAMLLGLLTEKHDLIAVQDFGIDNKTDADGLAVGRPSGFVGQTLAKLIAGVYTVEDDQLYRLLSSMAELEKIYLEPSGLAGVMGPIQVCKSDFVENCSIDLQLKGKLENAVHISWATGGGMVPKEVMDAYYAKGISLNS